MHKNPGWRDDFRFLYELCETYNLAAQRAVKLMEELHGTCKIDKYLNSKFINTNSEI